MKSRTEIYTRLAEQRRRRARTDSRLVAARATERIDVLRWILDTERGRDYKEQ